MNIYNLTEEFISSDVNINRERMLVEAKGIYNNPFTRRNRDFEIVLKMTTQGHILEQFLIDNHCFSDNQEKYLDLISPDGFNVDCKTITLSKLSEYYVKKLITDMIQKNIKYNSNVKYIIIYTVDDLVYRYYATIEI